ncbi:isoprenylcysteine carboxylmethyltransferase family protein [Methylococcus sp. EFPC2]|uniref:methyltransferase family protein n=1 Tax=Methylococcus sp. EFPC2 TaxID=2812648 RepID=UPI001968A388|nr:isoprenylcysteine carboxylmethyltransferase family protein [Methylococcus sp. EFPC2]QSA97891.1 isoprenylcysteine carboxylmethyltransferase family protein [Methylococcus sp. EFPC2]
MTTLPESGPGGTPSNWLRPAAWLFYLAIVLEILFMISPAAGYFYALYGPSLNVLDHAAVTAWLTQFFLPHISTTRSGILNAIPWIGGFCVMLGGACFLAAAAQLYWAKFRRLGVVATGLYGISRHPQYIGLAVLGLGCLLLWPRFLVLLSYVLMLFLYRLLAAAEERRCEQQFGRSYREYRSRTAMASRAPPSLPEPGSAAAWAKLAQLSCTRPGRAFIAVLAALLVALGFREYTLSQISAYYEGHAAVLSPALLDGELLAAYRTATGHVRVSRALAYVRDKSLLVHVLPEDWYLADLPMETATKHGGHYTPANFDRRRYKLLFSRARTHDPQAAGKGIVRSAYGIDPIIVVRVDIAAGRVTGVDTPPAHVLWGDIPTPLF